MKSKLFDIVRGRVHGFCISAMFLLAVIPSVHSSSSAASVEVIATGLNDISGLRLDDNDLYFVDYGSKDVKKFDLNTSTLSTLIGGNSGEGGVAIDNNNVYFFLNGTVKKVSKSGGSVTTLISNIAGGGISDDTYLYFVQDNAIKKIPVNGGTISTVTTEYTGSISGMAVDDTYLYWGDTSGGNGAGKILRTPKSSSSTFVIQPGPEGTDTCYGTVYATKGTPDAASLYIGGWGDWYYDFFWFDLAGSPSAAETASAKLYLYGSAPNDPGFKLNRITESWTEAGVTLANNPASVFYKKFGSFTVGADGWSSVDITKLYKNWKKGRYPNYGVKLVPTRNNQTNGWIASSDHENSAIRPKIIVTRRASKDVIEAGSDMSRK